MPDTWPDTWVPTCTVVTAPSLPVALTVELRSPRVTSPKRKAAASPLPSRRRRKKAPVTSTSTAMAAIRIVFMVSPVRRNRHRTVAVRTTRIPSPVPAREVSPHDLHGGVPNCTRGDTNLREPLIQQTAGLTQRHGETE